jgi:hypothetical protein
VRTRVTAVVALVLALGVAATACSGGGDDAAETRRFFRGADCATLRRSLDQSDLAASLAGPTDPTAELQETAGFLRDARRRAPDDLVADVRTLETTFTALAKDTKAVDWAAIGRGDAMATIPASRLARRIADPHFGAAAFAVAQAAARSCPA